MKKVGNCTFCDREVTEGDTHNCPKSGQTIIVNFDSDLFIESVGPVDLPDDTYDENIDHIDPADADILGVNIDIEE